MRRLGLALLIACTTEVGSGEPFGDADGGSETAPAATTGATPEPPGSTSSESDASSSTAGPTEDEDDSAETTANGTTTGPAPACLSMTDCEDENPCTVDACIDNACTYDALDGNELDEQVGGDCRTVVCIDGEVGEIADTEDLPYEAPECMWPACAGLEPSSVPAPSATACGDGLQCDGAGACIECLAVEECTDLPEESECQVRACALGFCEMENVDGGTAVPDELQIAGNCNEAVCDGEGGIVQQVDDSDVPIDNNPCVIGQCSGGTATWIANIGASCSDGNQCTSGDHCGSGGACIGGPSPCPGADNDDDCSESCSPFNGQCNWNDPPGSTCLNGTGICNFGNCNFFP